MKWFTFFLFLVIGKFSFTQVVYGTNNYVEYRPGSLPLVISVPHGGSLTPSSIPDRTCNNPVLVTDANTIELAESIDSSLYAVTGCRPHMIICHLDRSKLDCNRNLADGACGNSDAETAWTEFYNFIEQAQNGEKIFYIDLHGHGNPIQRIELGYLLYEDELEFSDATLNSSQYIAYSSLQHLVASNVNGQQHTDLLRGEFALGTLLANLGFPAVPSQQDPFPGIGSNYFSGGYNTANHTSYAIGNLIDGVQMECNYTGVRDSHQNRVDFADALSEALIQFFDHHTALQINNSECGFLSIEEFANPSLPNSFIGDQQSVLEQIWKICPSDFVIYELNGNVVFNSASNTSLPKQILKGIYLIKGTSTDGSTLISKIVIPF
jgi:hypothetical protein